MTIKIISTILLSFILVNCSSGGGNERENNHQKLESQLQNSDFSDKCKTLLLIAEDRSGSAQGSRKLTLEDYQTLGNHFQENYTGQMVVRTVGNPSPNQRNFYTFPIRDFKKEKMIDSKAKMSVQAAIRKQNINIRKNNALKVKKDKTRLNEFFEKTISKNVINYSPYKGKDVTDVAEALSHVQKKINEPTFDDYDKIMVVIISDGVHSANKLKEELSFNTDQNIELYLINWVDLKVFSNHEFRSFEGIDGFKNYFLEQGCN